MNFRFDTKKVGLGRAIHESPLRMPHVLGGAGPPRLVLVRKPDQPGVEREHPQLAFGVRLVELAKPNRHVAAHGATAAARGHPRAAARTPGGLLDFYHREAA